MDINDIFTKGLDFDDALDLLGPLSIYVLGISGYGVLVFKFYRFVAARDMFELDLSRYEGLRLRWARSLFQSTLYMVKYLILFPLFAFFWFAALTLILAFLSKGQSFSETLLIAVATVSAIRLTAYYNEDLSKDLAKILPFAVMGVFLIDASFFSLSESLNTLNEAGGYSANIFYYLVFLIALEFVLRILMGVTRLVGRLEGRTHQTTGQTVDSKSTPTTETLTTRDESPRTPPREDEESTQELTLPHQEESSDSAKRP